MRKADLAVALLFLATTSASLGTGSPDSRRIPRTVTVYCDGTPHEFTLSRAAEASSPFTALRSKLSKHFGHLKYKNFFSMEGEPLDQFGLLPENVRASVPCGFRVDAVIFIDAPDGKSQVVVQRQDSLWFWPTAQIGFQNTVELGGVSARLTTLATSPRAFLVENFASEEECAHIISKSKEAGAFVRSGVTLTTDKDLQLNESRTSTNVKFFDGKFYYRSDPLFLRVLERASKLAHVPVQFSDPQIVHYDAGQHFNAHYDWLKLPEGDKTTAQRLLTILLYLNDVNEGGETIFPATSSAFLEDPARRYDASLCTSSYDFIRTKPKAGTAVLFYNLHENGHLANKVDPGSIHAGCPIPTGEKWAVNFWFYNRDPKLEFVSADGYEMVLPDFEAA